ncbi:hypothetical protein YK48G_16640 [Lentilactobacillus fungorum]|uniref:SSD domain-containing protein n=1 Tax=Lentilactobacillus fungorum TaxID=2201250 RepID=A0ABQ3W250_9LACO|nr:hydrophobe/amphiphile efflux-3 (HAE3) family transporter [Lentilactobacillus fungorum]GHP14239.1 hypothetical protein YK48G_16640 [Lentilactobacillus fungorum]
MKKLFSATGQLIYNHSKLALIIIGIITVILGLGLPRIQMNTGNSMFVSQSSQIAKDSATYQKQFGNDVFIVDIQNSGQSTVSPATFKKVHRFAEQAQQIDGIKSVTDVAGVLNGELNSSSANALASGTGTNSAKLQTSMMAQLSAAQKKQLQQFTTKSLSTAQQKQLSAYTVSILTSSQKAKMAQAASQSNQSATSTSALTKLLSTKQQLRVQAYTQKILTKTQTQALAAKMLSMLPAVQNMSADLLNQLIYSDNGKVPSSMSQLLPKNGQHLLVTLTTTANTDMNQNNTQYKQIQHLIKQAGLSSNHYTAAVAGSPAVAGTVGKQMTKSMAIMLAAAVVIMFVILLLVFPVRRRLLPLVFVLIGMVWTFGLMGWLKIDLTMATMATLPILIGLGTDFGVQFLNRYEEEFKKDPKQPANAVATTAGHSGMAVGIAGVVMILSFLTMLISKAPMLKFFGITLAIGVLMCYIVEFSLTFAIVSLLDQRTNFKQIAKLNTNKSWLNHILANYAKWVMKHAGVITIIGVLIGGIGFFFESHISIETNLIKMIPQDLPALKANNKVIKEIGSTTNFTYLVRSDDVRQKDNLQAIHDFGNQVQAKYGKKTILDSTSLATSLGKSSLIQNQKQINTTISGMPAIIRQNLLSHNHQYATITFKINPDLKSDQQLKLMNKISKDAKNVSGDLTIRPAGSTSMMLQGINNMTANHELIIIAGLITIFIVLLLVYRHFHYAIYPLLPIVIVLGLSPMTLKLLGISYNPVTISLSSLILGIGTEFTILVLERYIEERRRGENNEQSIETALGSVGQAITVSGLTVIAGFTTLTFVNFPVLRSFGFITVLDTAYALISTLTILPAIIYLLRPKNKTQGNPNLRKDSNE